LLLPLAAGAQAVPKGPELKALSINCMTLKVPDIRRTSQFYQEFFGIKLEQSSEMA
jgi:predicted enzyme related to lactoylglutathione lyase